MLARIAKHTGLRPADLSFRRPANRNTTHRHTPNYLVASSPFARYTSRLRYGFVLFESVLYLVVKHQPRPIAGGNGEKMSLGLLGRKVGMMRIFTDEGDSIPVTVLDVSNNRVAQIKTPETDGYSAVQVAFGQRRASRVTKAVAGHHAKAGVEAGTMLREFRVEAGKAAELKAGDVVAASLFEVGQKIDVQGVTIGKGYAGVIKRYHFASGRATHGNSRSHNVPGSIGMAQDPGRVFPGKRMTGHLGDVNRTVQNLEIARIDADRQLLLVKGAVPGAKNGQVIVSPAIKSKVQKGA